MAIAVNAENTGMIGHSRSTAMDIVLRQFDRTRLAGRVVFGQGAPF